MIEIAAVTSDSNEVTRERARDLFRAYGEFLRECGGEALLCFSRLDSEIEDLPRAYAERGGEVLVANDGQRGAGCIAYRNLSFPGRTRTCELKRLFVHPDFRGCGLGRRLITTALERAQAKGYIRACLDTEPRSMSVARQLYRDLGFVEDAERNAAGAGDVVYFQKMLSGE